MPLSLFRFEGFSVVTATNVTEQYAIEIIKDSILNRGAHNDDFYYDRVVQALKTIMRHQFNRIWIDADAANKR